MSNRNKNILLGILIVGVLAMTVAFAALTTRLNLNGTANVQALKWNIHFDGWDNVTQDTVDGHSNTSEIDDTQISQTLSPNITKIDNVNVTLKQPGDYIKYNFIIKNDGTIAAKLDNFTKTLTPTNEVVGFTVNCYESNTREGTPITTNYVLPADGTVYCYLEVQYKDQTNTNTSGSNQVYEQSRIETSLSAEWTWVQDDSNSSSQSGSQESGNEQGSSTEPTETYTYTLPDGSKKDKLDSSWTLFLRTDSSNVIQNCAQINGSVVCFNPYTYENEFGTKDENNKWKATGYAASKIQEFEKIKGVTCDITETNATCEYNDLICIFGIDGPDQGSTGCRTNENGCYNGIGSDHNHYEYCW